MRLLVFIIILAALAQVSFACVERAGGTGSATVETVECTGASVIWLNSRLSTPGPMSAGEDLVVQGEIVRLEAYFNVPAVGTITLSMLNQTYSARVEPDAYGKSAANFYITVPDVNSGDLLYTLEGLVEKVVCPNSTVNESLRLSGDGKLDVAGCSSFESSILERQMLGVSERLALAEKTFYDALELLGGRLPDQGSSLGQHLIASLKNYEDSKYYSRQFAYEHDERRRCAAAKLAAAMADSYAAAAYNEASMAYSLAANRSAASSIGFYEALFFASVASAVYLLLGRKCRRK